MDSPSSDTLPTGPLDVEGLGLPETTSQISPGSREWTKAARGGAAVLILFNVSNAKLVLKLVNCMCLPE